MRQSVNWFICCGCGSDLCRVTWSPTTNFTSVLCCTAIALGDFFWGSFSLSLFFFNNFFLTFKPAGADKKFTFVSLFWQDFHCTGKKKKGSSQALN